MSAASDLAEARAARDRARAEFDETLFRLRGDPEAQSMGEHLIERIGEDARHGLDKAIDIAGESKGIAAATAALLAMWFLRHPLLGWIGELLDGLRHGDDDE